MVLALALPLGVPIFAIVEAMAGMPLVLAVGLHAGVTLVEQIGRALAGGPVNFRPLGVVARAVSCGVIGVMGGLSLGAQRLVLGRHAPACKACIRVNA